VPHAVALNSCTAGLHLACLVLGLQPGDEVITTPMTFCATVNAIVHAGATPVLADVDPVTMNIDPEQVRKKITPRTARCCRCTSPAAPATWTR
jgi:dTDP-4-amino-4,6-dideoxygalactose transaminase